MRDISFVWDDELVERVCRNFSVLEKPETKGSTLGYVGEALVQKYYKQPINDKPRDKENGDDGGVDLMVNGFTVDVKCRANNYRYFGYGNAFWSVACYHGMRAQLYLFTEIDPMNKKIELTGWLTADEVRQYGEFIPKGTLVCGRPSNGDCYKVSIKDIHPIFEKEQCGTLKKEFQHCIY